MPQKTPRIIQVIVLAILTITSSTVGQQPKAQPPKSVRLYVFDCGTLDIPDTSAYQLKKEELATTKMSVPCYLVAHPKGTLIWDVGAIPDSSFKPDGTHAPLRYATSKKRLTDQLAQIGYTPSAITYLSVSHFHWDHVATRTSLRRRSLGWSVPSNAT
jgi:glyoxylase-like metal-dependent hydrolase (beta-lactamase superfamily II)